MILPPTSDTRSPQCRAEAVALPLTCASLRLQICFPAVPTH